MTNTSRELREWAARCADMANAAESAEEQDRLRRKSEALRALADTEDWLAGTNSEATAGYPAEAVSISQQAAE